jgi:hypothetical protein
VNINSTVYTIIIHSFPCYLLLSFLGGINGFLKKFLSHFFFIPKFPKHYNTIFVYLFYNYIIIIFLLILGLTQNGVGATAGLAVASIHLGGSGGLLAP